MAGRNAGSQFFDIERTSSRALARQADQRASSEQCERCRLAGPPGRSLEGSGTASAGSRPQEHAELTRILARPEFAGNAPPTRWELFQQRIIAWIRDMLERIFSFAAQHPSRKQDSLLGGDHRRNRHPRQLALAALDSREPDVVADSAGTGREGSNLGGVASRQPRRRGPGRSTGSDSPGVLGGIGCLQEVRALPVNTSQTPRENLRLLSEPKPGGAPASPAFQESLSGLTSGLERFWYARRLAGPDDFLRIAAPFGGTRMQGGLSPTDRKLMWGFAVVFVLPGREHSRAWPAPGGGRRISILLFQRLRRRVGRLSASPGSALPGAPMGATAQPDNDRAAETLLDSRRAHRNSNGSRSGSLAQIRYRRRPRALLRRSDRLIFPGSRSPC